MREYIIVLALLVAANNHTVEPMFKPDECALFIDQPGVPDKSMVVKVEGFKDGHYLYRWWVLQGGWSVEQGKAVGEESMFNRLFLRVDCPDVKHI